GDDPRPRALYFDARGATFSTALSERASQRTSGESRPDRSTRKCWRSRPWPCIRADGGSPNACPPSLLSLSSLHSGAKTPSTLEEEADYACEHGGVSDDQSRCIICQRRLSDEHLP